MSLYQPTGEMGAAQQNRRRLCTLVGLAAVLALCALCQWGEQPAQSITFVAAPNLRARVAPQALASLSLRAKTVDAEVVGDEDDEEGEEMMDEEMEGDEEMDEDEAEEMAGDVEASKVGGDFPSEAYAAYDNGAESPPESWFKRRQIDRHKVNLVFFDQYKKPKSFFPHKLQPGDTVRVTFLEAQEGGQGDMRANIKVEKMQRNAFTGVIMRFKGEYHARTITLRTIIGSGVKSMGHEINFPMHSPLVQKIQVLRRGYIGRNKNAYFIRGMIGRRNVIPLDKERTAMDDMYNNLKLEFRADEIPSPEYPQQEWDRYPLPVWKQDADDWDEEKYKPEDVDQRSDYEVRIIGAFRKRVPGPTGRAIQAGGR